jgi:hypothetical protein
MLRMEDAKLLVPQVVARRFKYPSGTVQEPLAVVGVDARQPSVERGGFIIAKTVEPSV